MPKSLRWIIVLGAAALLIHGFADAKTQKKNYNLNCGLIGSFARYPQHNNLCKWQVFCIDPKTCIRKLIAVPQKDLEAVVSEEESALSGETPPSDPSNSGLNLSLGVQGSVTAGGLNAGASAGAAAGTDSGGGSGSADAGASAGGSAGGATAGAGGGLGVGGL